MDLIVNSPINLIEKYSGFNPYQYIFAPYLRRPDYRGWVRATTKFKQKIVLDIRGINLVEAYVDHKVNKLMWFGEFEGSIDFQDFLKAVALSPNQIGDALPILGGFESEIELWIVESGENEVLITSKKLPNIRPFEVHILLGKKLEPLHKNGRVGLVDDLVKLNSWDQPIDFSDCKFHLMGVWDGYSEILGYRNSIFKSLITSYPIKLGLKGRTLKEDRPFLEPLNFEYTEESFNEWTHRNINELRELLNA